LGLVESRGFIERVGRSRERGKERKEKGRRGRLTGEKFVIVQREAAL
jgi:hypothetical protein